MRIGGRVRGESEGVRIGGRAEREDRKNRTPHWENHFSCHNNALSCACIYTCIVVKYRRRVNLIFTVEARMISLQARVAIVFKLNNPSLHTCVCPHSTHPRCSCLAIVLQP